MVGRRWWIVGLAVALVGAWPALGDEGVGEVDPLNHNDTWDSPYRGKDQTASALLEHTLPMPVAGAAAAAGPSGGFLFGGKAATHVSDEVWVFDASTETVSDTGHRLPGPRAYAAAVHVNDTYLVIGGYTTGGNYTDTILRYDPITGAVDQLSSRLPRPMQAMTAVVHDDIVWVVGGRVGPSESTRSILRIDPAADDVRVHDVKLPNQLAYASAVLHEDHIYVYAGAEPGRALRDVFRLDPTTGEVDTWRASGTGVYRAHAVASHGFLYLVAGRENNGQLVDGSWALDPVSGQFRWTWDPLPRKVMDAGTIAVGDLAYLFGGRNGGGTPTDSIMRFEGFAAPPVPVVDPASPTEECTGNGAQVWVRGSKSWDPNGDPLHKHWEVKDVTLHNRNNFDTYGYFPLGVTPVEFWVSDGMFRRSQDVDVSVVDTIKPSLTITRPTANALYVHNVLDVTNTPTSTVAVGPLTVRANASDSCAFGSVTFRLSGVGWKVDKTPPFEATFNPPLSKSGPVRLTVTAVDVVGNTKVRTIDYEHYGTW